MRFFPVLAAVLLVLIGADISEPRPADAASYCSAFRADLNIPDGTTMSPGQSFSKGWRLNNCGTAWNGVKAVRISGNFGPGEFGVPAAGAGANADLWTNMNAPTASGRHRATYRLRGPAGDFGTTFWVEVQVNAPAPPPPPAPTANDCMQFVRDLSYGDGAVVSAGQGFDKGWELRNCGNTNWNGYSAVRVGGGYGPDRFGVPGIGPNSSGGLWTRITAPGTAGRHRATYQLEGPRGRFGPQFWVEVVVSAPTGRLTVSSGLVLSSTNPRTGENVTVDFTVTNSGGQALTIQELTAGGRRGTDWNGEWMDFPHVANIVLQPGQSYRYRQARSFPGAGAHFAEPSALINGSWGGIAGGNRVNFTVSGVPAGRLQISQPLTLSTTNPSTSQAVTARFAVRNSGGQAIRFNILAAARRGTDWGGENVDWPQQFDITLQPGQEYRYEQTRTFAGQATGGYFAEPAVFTSGQWSGIDGGNRVTFTVGSGGNNGGSDADLISKAKEQTRGLPQPEWYTSCLVYAQARGGVPIAGGNSGAYNVLYTGNNAASGTIKSGVRALSGVGDFTQVLKSGDFIVWNRGAGGADATYGHIAVVEIVEKDRIVISNANWPPAWRVLRPGDMKAGMYAFPKGTK